MRMDDHHMELRFLKCIVENDTDIKISALDEGLFTNSACIKVFHKVRRLLDAGRDMVSWENLRSSVHLEDTEKDWMLDTEERIGDIESADDLDYAYEQLKEYWSYRILQRTANDINRLTNEGQPAEGSLDDMLRAIDQQLENIRGMDAGVEVWDLGQDCPETTELIARAINPDETDFYPTGFAGYDDVNRGIPTTGVLLLAGNTGVGKSAIAANLCYKWKDMGLRPAIVPLEMDATEMTRRWVSAIANVELSRITNLGEENLTEVERDMIHNGIMEWFQNTEQEQGGLILWAPKRKEGITLQEILYGVRSQRPDVIVIDQASLISNNTDESEWKHLDDMMKACKRFAWVNKIPIVWLQQLDKELELRYAKRTLDDADVAWFLKETRDEDTMEVVVRKARGGIRKNFYIDFNKTYLRAEDGTDLDEDDTPVRQTATTVQRRQHKVAADSGEDDSGEPAEAETVNSGFSWLKRLR